MKNPINIIILLLILIILVLIMSYINIETFQATTSSSLKCKEYLLDEFEILKKDFYKLKNESKGINDVIKTKSSTVAYKFDWNRKNFGEINKSLNTKARNIFADDTNCKKKDLEVCFEDFNKYLDVSKDEIIERKKIIDKYDLRPIYKWKQLVERIYRYNVFKQWCDTSPNNCNVDCYNCSDNETKQECIDNYYNNVSYRCKSNLLYYKEQIDQEAAAKIDGEEEVKAEPDEYSYLKDNPYWYTELCDNSDKDTKYCSSACDCGGYLIAEHKCRKKNPSVCYHSGAYQDIKDQILPLPKRFPTEHYKKICDISHNVERKCEKMKNGNLIHHKDYYNCLLEKNLKKCDYMCNCSPNNSDFDIKLEDISIDDDELKKLLMRMDSKEGDGEEAAKQRILDTMKNNFQKNLNDKCIGYPVHRRPFK